MGGSESVKVVPPEDTPPASAACACGVIGLGVMGSQLVLNLAESLKQPIAGLDLDQGKVDGLARLAKEQGNLPVHPYASLAPFIGALSVPRRIILLVPAGRPVEGALTSLQPVLQPDDVIVDCGNEWYEKTEERQKRLEPTGIVYLGCGLSGGEEGARRGPCLMPGGKEAGWLLLKPLLESIAAVAETSDGQRYPCVRYIGPGGAGQYVKMVHNGIEYGDMQLISEARALRKLLALYMSDVHVALSRAAGWNSRVVT